MIYTTFIRRFILEVNLVHVHLNMYEKVLEAGTCPLFCKSGFSKVNAIVTYFLSSKEAIWYNTFGSLLWSWFESRCSCWLLGVLLSLLTCQKNKIYLPISSNLRRIFLLYPQTLVSLQIPPPFSLNLSFSLFCFILCIFIWLNSSLIMFYQSIFLNFYRTLILRIIVFLPLFKSFII